VWASSVHVVNPTAEELQPSVTDPGAHARYVSLLLIERAVTSQSLTPRTCGGRDK